MTDLTVIGNKISTRREEIGMDQQTLSDYTGVGVTTISVLENGKGNISIKSLLEILDVLGLDLAIKTKQMI